MALALVRDLRDHRVRVSEEDLADSGTDVMAGFVLARASAGLADSTIRDDTGHLQLIRDWFGRPLWEMQPDDADASAGCCVMRGCRCALGGRVTPAAWGAAHWHEVLVSLLPGGAGRRTGRPGRGRGLLSWRRSG